MIAKTTIFTQGVFIVRPKKSGNTCHCLRISALLTTVVALAGCAPMPHTQSPRIESPRMQSPRTQSPQVVVVTPQEQAARLIYGCANGSTLDVTRIQGNTSALVVAEGKTIQLRRDATVTNAERYTNQAQTLTLYGTSATLDTLGRSTSGPCSINVNAAPPPPPPPPSRSSDS